MLLYSTHNFSIFLASTDPSNQCHQPHLTGTLKFLISIFDFTVAFSSISTLNSPGTIQYKYVSSAHMKSSDPRYISGSLHSSQLKSTPSLVNFMMKTQRVVALQQEGWFGSSNLNLKWVGHRKQLKNHLGGNFKFSGCGLRDKNVCNNQCHCSRKY